MHEGDEITTVGTSAPKERRIFISYRRSDCQAQANAINDGLRHRLQPARVFMDIDSIPAGVDFAQHIREEIRTPLKSDPLRSSTTRLSAFLASSSARFSTPPDPPDWGST